MAEEAKWYVVHTYSGYENAVAAAIMKAAENRRMQDLIQEVNIPLETVTEITDKGPKEIERKVFPGYVLVKMEMTDESWHLVKNTPKVTGFLGARERPTPISEAEAQRILHQVTEGVERPKNSISFDVGEQVRVTDGPFASFIGFVEETDDEKARLKVSVSIFGRSTPVELEYSQVEKV